jgi:hypothetical protein
MIYFIPAIDWFIFPEMKNTIAAISNPASIDFSHIFMTAILNFLTNLNE